MVPHPSPRATVPSRVPSCGTSMARHTDTRGDAAPIPPGTARYPPACGDPHSVDAVINAATRPGSIRMVPFQLCNLGWFLEKESTMRRFLAKVLSHFEARPLTPQGNHDVRSRSAAGGYALSPVELDAVHGGELNIEVPRYIPLSESHPKTERPLPRVTLLG